jgi:HD-like signal output (HDOD) protein
MEAIASLAGHRPDLVLLDLTMPDIGGIVLLRQMRKSPLFKTTPVVILSAHSDRDFVGEALSLGVRDYMLKVGFLVDDLLARIRTRLEEAGVLPPRPRAPSIVETGKPLYSRMELGDFLEGLEGKTLPTSRTELLDCFDSSFSSLDSMEDLLLRDPVVAARIMGRARSLLTRKRPLGKVSEALQILGVAVQQSALEETGTYAPGETVPEDLQRAWAHAIFCSRWMGRFCPEMGAAALVGLCHDLPEILLMQRMKPEEWASLRDVARSRSIVLPHLVEELFGIPYGEFANAVLRRLELPEEIALPILEHANAFLSSAPAPATRDALRLETANQWAHAHLLASTRNVPLRLAAREEVEPRLRGEERVEIGLMCDGAWAETSHVFQGIDLAPESFRLGLSPTRPRFVLRSESWVHPQSALEHLLAELGIQRTEPFEELSPEDWDFHLYLGDHPAKAWPDGFPHPKPLVVLHRLPRDACSFPKASRLEELRLPGSLAQLERFFASLA